MTSTTLLRVVAVTAGVVGLVLAILSLVRGSSPDLATSMVVLAAATLLLYERRRAGDKTTSGQ